MYGLPKTLPHSRTGSWTIYLVDCAHILAYRVVKGALVGQGYLLN
jgi:hypothetical protein